MQEKRENLAGVQRKEVLLHMVEELSKSRPDIYY